MVSHAWSHLHLPVSLTPVLFLSVRCSAIARSVLVRNTAFCGLSGIRKMMSALMSVVTAPRIRKSSCQFVIEVMCTLPIP
jgi:hypothetical protein